MKSYFPDVNVWVALAYRGHQHHTVATDWLNQLDRDVVYFCRVTQLSFLRLVNHSQVMGEDAMSQSEAWAAYDSFLGDDRIFFHLEPAPDQLDSLFRQLTVGRHPSARPWPDAYLSAFAQAADLILVTFDHGLHQMTSPGSLLLK